jgi:hypothetical protein
MSSLQFPQVFFKTFIGKRDILLIPLFPLSLLVTGDEQDLR